MPRVIVVEDDRFNALLFQRVLTTLGGYDVTVTESAEETLRLAREHDTVLILMDVSLSSTTYQGRKLDGLELARLLRADAATARVPIILATAHAMRGDRESLLASSGADGYVSKPIEDHAALVAQVRALACAPGDAKD